jgi:hypothetical protein
MRIRLLGPTLGLLVLALAGGCGGMGSGEDMSAAAPDDGASGTTVVAEGRFEGRRRYDTGGSYTIERAGGDLSLILEDDFGTEQGPDLWVVLSPVDTSRVSAQNVETRGAVVVDSLRAVAGRQTYALRNGTPVDSLASVAIHCREFDALFGVAPLE